MRRRMFGQFGNINELIQQQIAAYFAQNPPSAGVMGQKGDRGEQGLQGAAGDAGPIGIGSPGERGEKGNKGDTGAAGLRGDQGPQGLPGAQGQKGDTGPIGPAGSSTNARIYSASLPALNLNTPADIAFTWDTPFADTNYSISPFFTGVAIGKVSYSITNKTTSGATVRCSAIIGAGAGSGVHVLVSK